MDRESAARGWAIAIARISIVLIAWQMLAAAMHPAHAATVYRCTGTHGELVFQDVPCADRSAESEMDAPGLPLIDPAAPPTAGAERASPARRARPRAPKPVRAGARIPKPPASWECRAANGEVFYRHTRCPGSVPGDGVVRIDYAERAAVENPRRRGTAWDRVPVRGTTIPRTDACQQIRAAGAAGRDGHLRDDKVSAYDRAMGRDPCDR